ncbi:hypothetical protein B0H16DRAFT_1884487 [Mycena metata]|uniref:RNase III domain-containing protein n=1 Tax=Mycena metata TaxID=1033252 RepID=A0AAD7NHC3_9AGAR|nr:hypothetical protein B0H16DRAFT_1884487 [Mycena metata]
MSSRNPLQAISHLLGDDILLRDPVPSRWRVPLDASPRGLLQQLDDETDTPWPPLGLLELNPDFPGNYPPEIPKFDDKPERLLTAFTSKRNKTLEWLGDAVVEAVLVSRVYSSPANASAPVSTHFFTKLIDKDMLGHLGLLYGMHLHDFMPFVEDRAVLPAMERISDSFEAVVGASLLQFDFEKTCQWLGPLLDPWVHLFSGRGAGIFVSTENRNAYDKTIHRFNEVPVAPWRPANPSVRSFTHKDDIQLKLSAAGLLTELGTDGPAWDTVDASGVFFPPNYPPTPQGIADIEPTALTHAMTDIAYHIHFGDPPNTGYRSLGLRLCKMAVTLLTVTKFETTPEHMVIMRAECLDGHLLARLGILYNLHRHLRVLRRANDDSYYISARESREAFEALVGVVYLTIGWPRLLIWLQELFLPWMEATDSGRLRASRSAECWRQAEEIHMRKRAARIEAQRLKAAARAEEERQKAVALQAKKMRAHGAATARDYASTAGSSKNRKTRRGGRRCKNKHRQPPMSRRL